MIVGPDFINSISENNIDISSAWIFTDVEAYSYDYKEVMLQPISSEAVPLTYLKFKVPVTNIEIRSGNTQTSPLLFAGVSFNISDEANESDNNTNSSVQQISTGVVGVSAPNAVYGAGTISIESAHVNLYSNSDLQGKIETYLITSATFTLTDGSEQYIVADYNSGSPIYRLESNKYNINSSNIVLIRLCWRNGNNVHSIDYDCAGSGLANKIEAAIIQTQPYKKSLDGGLTISETSTPQARTVLITGATVFAGNTPHVLPTFNSSTNKFTFATVSNGIWSYTSGTTQYNNTQYNPTTGLITLGNNNYGVNWLYRSVGNDVEVFYVLGSEEYPTLAKAQTARMRTDLSLLLRDHCILCGRIIIQKGASSGVVENVADVSFSSSQITNHNDLQNIQGGSAATSEYYHLSAATYNKLTSGFNPAVRTLFSGTSPISYNSSTGAISHSTTGTAGTYTKVVTNATGHVTSGSVLTSADIPTLPWSKVTNTPTLLSAYGITSADTLFDGKYLGINGIAQGALSAASSDKLKTPRTIATSGDIVGTATSFDGTANITIPTTLPNIVTANTKTKITYNAKGQVTSGGDLLASDIPNLDASKITTGTIDVARIPVLPSQVPQVTTNLASLTTAQQNIITSGTVVTTSDDGWRYVYTGTGSKTSSASYVQLADISPEWTTIANRPTTLAGYNISVSDTLFDSKYSLTGHNHDSRYPLLTSAYDNPSWVNTLAASKITGTLSTSNIPTLASYYLPLSGGTLTGALTGTTAYFSGKIQSNESRIGMGTYAGIDSTALSARTYGVSFGRILNAVDGPANGQYFNYMMLPEVVGNNAQNYLALGTTSTDSYVGYGSYGSIPTWSKLWHSNNLTNLNQLTNGPGYVTSAVGDVRYSLTSHLHTGQYLPLSGGTLTGNLFVGVGNQLLATKSMGLSGTSYSNAAIRIDRNDASGTSTHAGLGFLNNNINASFLYYDAQGTGFRYRTDLNADRQLWDSNNLTNLNQLTNGPGYVTSAVGNAIYASIGHLHTGQYLPLSGGSLTGPLSGTTSVFTGAIRAKSIRVDNYGTTIAGYIANSPSTRYGGLFYSGSGDQQTLKFGQCDVDGNYLSLLTDIVAGGATFSGPLNGTTAYFSSSASFWNSTQKPWLSSFQIIGLGGDGGIYNYQGTAVSLFGNCYTSDGSSWKWYNTATNTRYARVFQISQAGSLDFYASVTSPTADATIPDLNLKFSVSKEGNGSFAGTISEGGQSLSTKYAASSHLHTGQYLPLSGGTLNGALNGTTASFTTSITSKYSGLDTNYHSENDTYASWGHKSAIGQTNYAILQNSSGTDTFLNAGTALHFRISNAEIMSITYASATLSKPLIGTTASFTGSASFNNSIQKPWASITYPIGFGGECGVYTYNGVSPTLFANCYYNGTNWKWYNTATNARYARILQLAESGTLEYYTSITSPTADANITDLTTKFSVSKEGNGVFAGTISEGGTLLSTKYSLTAHTHTSINVSNVNETVISNGYNDASGALYVNYRGSTLAINEYRFCNGLTTGTLSNIRANNAAFSGTMSAGKGIVKSAAYGMGAFFGTVDTGTMATTVGIVVDEVSTQTYHSQKIGGNHSFYINGTSVASIDSDGINGVGNLSTANIGDGGIRLYGETVTGSGVVSLAPILKYGFSTVVANTGYVKFPVSVQGAIVVINGKAYGAPIASTTAVAQSGYIYQKGAGSATSILCDERRMFIGNGIDWYEV